MTNEERAIAVRPEPAVRVGSTSAAAAPPPIRWTSVRALAALSIALAADALQIAVFPWFAMGSPAVAAGVLDVAVAIAMTALLGWHIAWVPSFIVEALPVVDLFPTWTGAVVFVVFWKGRKTEK